MVLFLPSLSCKPSSKDSIPTEDIPRIDLSQHIVQTIIITIGYDGVAHLLETGEIIHHGTAEERTPVFQCRLIDDHLGPFRLDTFSSRLE
mgnify:CR=1 FL=1